MRSTQVRSAVLTAMLCTLALAGSSYAQAQSPAPSAPNVRAPPHACCPMAQLCPMHVQGASVSVAEVPNGAALVFTTTGGNVDELRRRVRQMAQMHNARASATTTPNRDGMTMTCPCGMMGGGMATGPQGRGMMGAGGGPMAMPRSSARVEDVPRGARLVLTPADPALLDVLRARVRAHAQRMSLTPCPMSGASPM